MDSFVQLLNLLAEGRKVKGLQMSSHAGFFFPHWLRWNWIFLFMIRGLPSTSRHWRVSVSSARLSGFPPESWAVNASSHLVLYKRLLITTGRFPKHLFQIWHQGTVGAKLEKCLTLNHHPQYHSIFQNFILDCVELVSKRGNILQSESRLSDWFLPRYVTNDPLTEAQL